MSVVPSAPTRVARSLDRERERNHERTLPRSTNTAAIDDPCLPRPNAKTTKRSAPSQSQQSCATATPMAIPNATPNATPNTTPNANTNTMMTINASNSTKIVSPPLSPSVANNDAVENDNHMENDNDSMQLCLGSPARPPLHSPSPPRMPGAENANDANARERLDALCDGQQQRQLRDCTQRAAAGDIESMKHLVVCYTTGTGGAERNISHSLHWMEAYLEKCDHDPPLRRQQQQQQNDATQQLQHDATQSLQQQLQQQNPRERRPHFAAAAAPPPPPGDPDTIRLFLFTSARLLLGSTTNASFPDHQRRLPASLVNPGKARSMLERAAGTYRCTASMKLLGNGLYLGGWGNHHPQVARDASRGLYWLARAAALGDGEAAFFLAMAFHTGPVTPVHPELERKWWTVAALLGHAPAKIALDLVSEKKRGPRMTVGEARKRLRHLGSEKNIVDYLETDATRNCSNPGCARVEASVRPSDRFSLCERCKQAKYCSRACQAQHWRRGGHRRECRGLESAKEELKRCNRNIALPFAGVCWACHAPEPSRVVERGRDAAAANNHKRNNNNHGRGTRESGEMLGAVAFAACSGCRVARYCSRECQVRDYYDGHKRDCELVCRYIDEADELLGELRDGQGSSSTGMTVE